jgi:hypothetical protein
MTFEYIPVLPTDFSKFIALLKIKVRGEDGYWHFAQPKPNKNFLNQD